MPAEKSRMDRRTFLTAASSAVGACGLGLAAVPFIEALQPTKDILAAGVVEVDLSDIREGELRTLMWRKQPVFVLHRTPEMIRDTEQIAPGILKDPARQEDRILRPEWLVCLGICTHLGCVPELRPEGVPGFDHPGFLCPCHGGEYDTLGRRLAGPPPENLHLLPYEFLSDTRLQLGSEAFPGFGADVRKVQHLPQR